MGAFRIKCFSFLLAVLLCAGSAHSKGDSQPKLVLQIEEQESFGGPYSLSVGSSGELFLLDRGQATLYRISPLTGEVIWRIDGSESGEAFIDPAYLSRPDGFFIYLTDRGSRKVWRIDYRGELRGSIDLAFAVDPVFLELISGRQMVVYDRASSLIHLLDDSGRALWSFPPGGGRTTQEPADIAVSPAGRTLYILWRDEPQITEVDIFGRTFSTIQMELPGFSPSVLAFVAVGREAGMLWLADREGVIMGVDPLDGQLKQRLEKFEVIWDIAAAPELAGVLYLLVGPEVALTEIKLETGD